MKAKQGFGWASIDHVVTDQGTGGAWCSACDEYLGSDPFDLPDICPGCHRRLSRDGNTYINSGGSD